MLNGGALEIQFGELLAQDSPLFPSNISTDRPGFLFGAQGRQTAEAPDYGIRKFGPYKYTQHAKNDPLIAVLCEASTRGRVEQFVESLRNGFPEETWDATRRKGGYARNPFAGGLLSKFRLTRVDFEFEELTNTSAKEYRAAIERFFERLPRKPDLALVQTRDSFKQLRGNDNPYFVSKAAFMEAGIPVQAVTKRNMEASDSQLPYILNNVALASYAKLDGVHG